MEIYFSDLTEDAQKRLLEIFGISSPKEMNWDVIPIFEFDEEDIEILTSQEKPFL